MVPAPILAPETAKDTAITRILAGLNFNQRRAVTAPSSGRLQIIAGPGTGKTKVLVSRVAFLLLKEGIAPHKIIVTTFTKKAANEMTQRLKLLLKGESIDLDKLLIGTFHSICFRIIKIYGSKIGLQDYSIADERDSNQILREVLEKLNSNDLVMASNEQEQAMFRCNKGGFDAKRLKTHISKLKSKNIVPENYHKGVCNRFLAVIYSKYQEKLMEEKVLDFDDCLLYCNRLITAHPVLNFVEHVLVDEFQDTNEVQLQLMYQFARGHPSDPLLQDNITIVGDPDQSIYGFRNAQSQNFAKMKEYYTRKLGFGCDEIQLTDNYRSTDGILRLSEAIMRQQTTRSEKNLTSLFETSFKPTHKILNSAEQEARWIVYQIEHLMALPNMPFSFNDMSVIVRAASQTRVIENEFTRRRIPYTMVRGKAFWDRKEVVTILDYLRVVASENDRIAYLRTLNYPKRGFGDKAMEVINATFELNATNNVLAFKTLKGLAIGKYNAKLSTKCMSNLVSYLAFIEEARDMLTAFSKVHETKRESTLMNIFSFIYSKSGLQREVSEMKDQHLNIMEVQKQLCEFTPKEEVISTYIGAPIEEAPEDNTNFLTKFIQSIGLYETQSNLAVGDTKESSKGIISISTIHGSKGLEWPVVFVPGLTEGLLPAAFAMREQDEESINEERRCFYVATTRPKILLYLSSYLETEGLWGRAPMTEVSRFLTKLTTKRYVCEQQEAFKSTDYLLRLYELVQKGDLKPNYKTFNMNCFKKLYEDRMWSFVKGTDFKIIDEDYSSANFNQVGNKLPSAMGFTSAKNELGKQLKYPPLGLRRVNKKDTIIEPESISQPDVYSSMLVEMGISQHNDPIVKSEMQIDSAAFSLNSTTKPRAIKKRKIESALSMFAPVGNNTLAVAKMLENRKYPPNKVVAGGLKQTQDGGRADLLNSNAECSKPKQRMNSYGSVIAMLKRSETSQPSFPKVNSAQPASNRAPLVDINRQSAPVTNKAPPYIRSGQVQSTYIPIKRAPAYIPNHK